MSTYNAIKKYSIINTLYNIFLIIPLIQYIIYKYLLILYLYQFILLFIYIWTLKKKKKYIKKKY